VIGSGGNGDVIAGLLEADPFDQHRAIGELQINCGGIRGFVGNTKPSLVGRKWIDVRFFKGGGKRPQETDRDQFVGLPRVQSHRSGNDRIGFRSTGGNDRNIPRAGFDLDWIANLAQLTAGGHNLAIDQHVERTRIGRCIQHTQGRSTRLRRSR
jgi:hypothetical protein